MKYWMTNQAKILQAAVSQTLTGHFTRQQVVPDKLASELLQGWRCCELRDAVLQN